VNPPARYCIRADLGETGVSGRDWLDRLPAALRHAGLYTQ